jgi:hypothetical protein
MFSVTLVNLARDARTAIEGGGLIDLGSLSVGELTGLLNNFAELDVLQNMKADPEVRVQGRRNRFIIRTGQSKLYLQDARNLSEPAYIPTASEIIAELDGSAAAKRTAQPPPTAPSGDGLAPTAKPATEKEITPMPEVEEHRWPLALIGLVLLLGGYVAYSEWASRQSGSLPAITPLTASERLAEDVSLTGVYMTGSEPGQHGIIILGDGKLKLFQANAQAAPGVVYGSYRFGRLESKLCLATDQPGGLIKVMDRESLQFCGEIYHRIP